MIDIPKDSRGFNRTLYPCPQCGKKRRSKCGLCRECKHANNRAKRQAVSPTHYQEQVVLDNRGYKRTLYPCPGCGKLRKANYGKCRKCHDSERKTSSLKERKCFDCSKPLAPYKTSKRCYTCEQVRRRTLKLGTLPEARAMSERERKKAQESYWLRRGEVPPDREVIAAAKFSRRQKKCPTCGVKITTRKCVACAVLNRVGEKGFR